MGGVFWGGGGGCGTWEAWWGHGLKYFFYYFGPEFVISREKNIEVAQSRAAL
jgi:hypothetical protein